MTAPIRWRRRWRGPGSRSRRSSIRGPSRARRRADWPTGIPLYSGHAVVGTAGRSALRRVRVRPSAAAEAGRGRSVDARLRSAGRVGRLEPECAAFRAGARPAALRPRSRGAGAGRERRGGRLRRGGERDFLARRLPRRRGSGRGAGRRRCAASACRAEPPVPDPPAQRRDGRSVDRRGRGAKPGRRRAADPARAVRRRAAARLCRSAQRRDRRRYRAGGARGLRGPRASEALHDARHGHRPGQDRQPRRVSRCSPPRPGRASPTRRRRRSARLMRRCRTALLAGRERGRARRPGAGHADARLACRGGRGVRGCRAVEAGALLPASRRGHGGGGAARVPRGARPGGAARRLDPGEDRGGRAGRGAVSRPDLYQPLGQSRGRRLPLRRDVP